MRTRKVAVVAGLLFLAGALAARYGANAGLDEAVAMTLSAALFVFGLMAGLGRILLRSFEPPRKPPPQP